MAEVDLYRNRDFVPDFDAIMAETAARSRELAARVEMRRDIAYGDTRRQRLDIVLPRRMARGAPLHMFVHGGYWRAGSKEDHTLVAGPVIDAGGIAALIGYDLMPGTRLGTIVGQVRRAARFLVERAADFGADPGRFTASGHSAGAHLASLLATSAPGDASPPEVPDLKGLLLVSGIYDLSGIPGSFLRDEAEMTPAEAEAWSPLSGLHLACATRIVTRGSEETRPFHDQAEALNAQMQAAGEATEIRSETGCNHLTVVLDLADASHPLGRRLADLVVQS